MTHKLYSVYKKNRLGQILYYHKSLKSLLFGSVSQEMRKFQKAGIWQTWFSHNWEEEWTYRSNNCKMIQKYFVMLLKWLGKTFQVRKCERSYKIFKMCIGSINSTKKIQLSLLLLISVKLRLHQSHPTLMFNLYLKKCRSKNPLNIPFWSI